MRKWNFVAMGQIGVNGVSEKVARPIAAVISRRTGRPEGQILAIIGAGFLAVSLIDFLRTVDSVVAAGRTDRPLPSTPTA